MNENLGEPIGLSRVVSLETKFQDFMDRYERDQKKDEAWKSGAMTAIAETTEAVRDLKKLRTAGIWALVTVVGAIVLALSTKFVDWVGRHF